MKRMLILAVTLWLGVSATAHAQTATPCPFGETLSADLTAFGCASDPLAPQTYQFSSDVRASAPTIAPAPGIGANAQTVTPNAAGGAGGGASSSASCVESISPGELFSGIGGC